MVPVSRMPANIRVRGDSGHVEALLCAVMAGLVPAKCVAFDDSAAELDLVPPNSQEWRNDVNSRRNLLMLAGTLAITCLIPRIGFALDYPTRPVRWIVPSASGSAADIIARLLGQWLSERLGQPFVIENRPGAGGNLATEAAVQAQPDGYTLLFIGASSMISPSLYNKLTFNFVDDIVPVASISRSPHVAAVHPSLSVHSIPEFIAYAKTNPGKLNEGSLTGGPVHLTSELFKFATGVNIVHVPYRGGTAPLADTLSGQLQVSFEIAGVLAEPIKAGKLRALAITSAARWAGLPDVPAMGEFIPGFEASFAAGVGVPKNTPQPVIEKLNKEINEGLADGRINARLTELGATPLIGSPAEFRKLIANEIARWRIAIRAANIKVE